MSLDPAPVLLLTSIIAATVGALLVFAYLQSRTHLTLLVWGCADLIGAVAAVLLVLRNAIPDSLSVVVPMGLLICAYAAIWAASQCFANRRPLPLGLAAGPLAWCVACAWPAILQSTERRVLISSVIIAGYTLAAARELWRDRREPLLSRYPLVACLLAHATMILGRGVVAFTTPMPDAAQVLTHPWAGIMALEPAILVVALGFLQLSMAMERSELVQRRAAMTDALTGIASRRAFIDQGQKRLASAIRDRVPVALLLFDLDHFKAINDGFGHEAGDDALRAFAARIEPLLGTGALFGRLGGEEFAAVLIGASPDAALVVGEMCRAEVEGLAVGPEGARPALSVSVGIAAAQGPCTLNGLLREADLALYGAKSAGRNGVKLNPQPGLRLPQAA